MGSVTTISGGGGGGTVQGTDETYDIRPADDGSTAGNSRGENSVDLQTNRIAVTQVASGNNSTIGGGKWNTSSGDSSTVGGGRFNIASGDNSTVAGGNGCDATAENSSVLGGYQNIAAGTRSSVLGGSGNEIGIAGTDAAVLGGAGAEIDAVYGVVVTGNSNAVTGNGAVILTGSSTNADVPYSVVHGGRYLSPDEGAVHKAENVLSVATTNSSTTEITSDGSNGIDLDEGDTLIGSYRVVSKRDNGDFAYWQETEFEITRTGSGNVVLLDGSKTTAAPDIYGNASVSPIVTGKRPYRSR